MTQPPKERRHFTRIGFDAWAELRQGERAWNTPVLDLSLKGLLVKEPAGWQVEKEAPLLVNISLDGHAAISMKVVWRHAERGTVGFECLGIDLDSVTTLRRLVELNLGDPALLERELGALGQ